MLNVPINDTDPDYYSISAHFNGETSKTTNESINARILISHFNLRRDNSDGFFVVNPFIMKRRVYKDNNMLMIEYFGQCDIKIPKEKVTSDVPYILIYTPFFDESEDPDRIGYLALIKLDLEEKRMVLFDFTLVYTDNMNYHLMKKLVQYYKIYKGKEVEEYLWKEWYALGMDKNSPENTTTEEMIDQLENDVELKSDAEMINEPDGPGEHEQEVQANTSTVEKRNPFKYIIIGVFSFLVISCGLAKYHKII